MKKTRFIVWVALGLGFATASCGNPEGVGKQQLFNNATHVDNEAFNFLKIVHEKATNEVALAKHIATQYPGTEAAGLTDQIVGLYNELLPQLEQLGAVGQVILPDPGQPALTVPTLIADTVNGFQPAAYLNHAAHEQYYILDQFKRATRNTNKAVRQFALDHIDRVKEVFVAAGGQEEEGAHH
jgi:hypothetical protein